MIRLEDFLLIMQENTDVKIRDNSVNVLFTGKSEKRVYFSKRQQNIQKYNSI